MTDIPETPDGDFLTVLSSELIAEVMEEYFNKKMYRQKVKVVDLQPQGSGYAFSLAFVKDTPTHKYDIYVSSPGNVTPVLVEKDVEGSPHVDYTLPTTPNGRDAKGKFTKKVH